MGNFTFCGCAVKIFYDAPIFQKQIMFELFFMIIGKMAASSTS